MDAPFRLTVGETQNSQEILSSDAETHASVYGNKFNNFFYSNFVMECLIFEYRQRKNIKMFYAFRFK